MNFLKINQTYRIAVAETGYVECLPSFTVQRSLNGGWKQILEVSNNQIWQTFSTIWFRQRVVDVFKKHNNCPVETKLRKNITWPIHFYCTFAVKIPKNDAQRLAFVHNENVDDAVLAAHDGHGDSASPPPSSCVLASGSGMYGRCSCCFRFSGWGSAVWKLLHYEVSCVTVIAGGRLRTEMSDGDQCFFILAC